METQAGAMANYKSPEYPTGAEKKKVRDVGVRRSILISIYLCPEAPLAVSTAMFTSRSS